MSILPLIMKSLIEGMTCEDVGRKKLDECATSGDVYLLIGLYVLTKFIADSFNYIREIPFNYMQAKAEVSIA